MKTMRERLKIRMKHDRKMTTISIRMPEDVIEDLREMAPALGFSGYQALMKGYIGQGLRRDQMRMDSSQLDLLTESLRNKGVAQKVISAAVAEAERKFA